MPTAGLRKLSRQVRGLKETIEGQFKANNLLFAAVPQQTIINLDNAMHEIRSAQPYCVCRACCGIGCYRCHDHGFMTGHQYRTLPEECGSPGVRSLPYSKMSVNDIYLKCGYRDPRFLRAVCTKTTGCSLLQWRNRKK